MARLRKQVAVLAAFAAASISLAACGSDDSSAPPSTESSGSTPTSSGGSSDAPTGEKGGNVSFLQKSGPEHLDPQRMYIGRDLANMGRLVYRSLVAFPTSEDDAELAATPEPDLATDIGTASPDSKTWSFTLKDGVKWQDGKDITCEDLKYGMSRTFATDVITGGPNYILGYLDVPTDKKTGLPIYTGPYKNTPEGKAAYDKAVTCKGNTITYKFKKPFADFPLAIASLRCFDPYREDLDKGDASNFTVFSSGPYMEEQGSTYNDQTGGKFVRNPEWDESTDTIRKALPDSFTFEVGVEPEIQYSRFLADSGPDVNAVTASSAPPATYAQINGDPAAADRAVTINSPFTGYLVPNFKTLEAKFGDKALAVREALAAGADKADYATALGGEKASKPSASIVAPAVPGYAPNPAFADVPQSGDPDAAKKILADAGVPTPVKLKFTFSGGTPTTEKAFGALIEGWNKSGFQIESDSQSDNYYTIVQNPDNDSDIMWGGWGADWPSIGTVIPPLFDSRINLTSSSNGQDYGQYKSDEVNGLIDAAGLLPLEEQPAAYADIDKKLGEDVAYIALDLTQFYYMRGSNVDNYVNSLSTSGYPDLAVISLKDPSKG